MASGWAVRGRGSAAAARGVVTLAPTEAGGGGSAARVRRVSAAPSHRPTEEAGAPCTEQRTTEEEQPSRFEYSESLIDCSTNYESVQYSIGFPFTDIRSVFDFFETPSILRIRAK